jgi:hypothetical protein
LAKIKLIKAIKKENNDRFLLTFDTRIGHKNEGILGSSVGRRHVVDLGVHPHHLAATKNAHRNFWMALCQFLDNKRNEINL